MASVTKPILVKDCDQLYSLFCFENIKHGKAHNISGKVYSIQKDLENFVMLFMKKKIQPYINQKVS